jgi:hypothetical protein
MVWLGTVWPAAKAGNPLRVEVWPRLAPLETATVGEKKVFLSSPKPQASSSAGRSQEHAAGTLQGRHLAIQYQATCFLVCVVKRASRRSVPAILRSNRAILAKMVWRCISSNLRREFVPDGFMALLP